MIQELQFPNRATPPGSRNYYCIRIAPLERRNELALLFLWRQEIRDILYRCTDPGVAQAKLKWYREELERALQGAAQQPLAQALAVLIQHHRLPTAPFHSMADALQSDLNQTGYQDMQALREYCRQDMGALLQLATQVGGGDEAEIQCAEQLGTFVRLVDIIRNLGPDLNQGCRHLPRSELEKAGLSVADIPRPENKERLQTLLSDMTDQGRQWHTAATRDLTTGRHPALIPALSLAAMNRVLLTELDSSGFPVIDQRICITPLRKLWITWRTNRRKRWA